MNAPTSKVHDPYLHLKDPDAPMRACPCCGAHAELWEHQPIKDGPASKVVMCSTAEAFGPQQAISGEGCPLYLPGDEHYRATVREAVKYWNEYSQALEELQRKNRWASHQAMRIGGPA